MLKRKATNFMKNWINTKDKKCLVVQGARQTGKTYTVERFAEENYEELVEINFKQMPSAMEIFSGDLTVDAMVMGMRFRFPEKKIIPGKTLIFLDEIQKVAAFEKVVDSLYVKPDIDIYITGSNAYMLSSDLATLLTGRYVEIRMLPLSFKEFLGITALDAEQGLTEYLRDGGLPYIAVMNRTSEKVETYLEGIYNTVIVKDIEDRQARKESEPSKRKITDITLLKTIAKYLASVAGNPVSIRSITNYLTSNGRKLSPNTVSDYVDALIESFIFYPAERFDIVGKQLLKANRKLYIVDLGLRNYILPRQNYDLGFSLENIVYFELLRRGYRVMIGKVGNTEVDFVAERKSTYSYIQVTADMTAKETFERELKPLSNIRDNYEKIVLTADRFTPGNYNGIQVKYLPDWLLGKNS